MTELFTDLSRQKFRDYFQPSRIVLCLLPTTATESRVNVITLCFSMCCSYKPNLMAVAIQDCNESYSLIQATNEYVLAVPGESLANEAMVCGRQSVRDSDKIKKLGLELSSSSTVDVPGLMRAIANIEMRKFAQVDSGDHVLVVGEVVRYAVNTDNTERPLVSVGSQTAGYKVLSHEGIHRIAVVG